MQDEQNFEVKTIDDASAIPEDLGGLPVANRYAVRAFLRNFGKRTSPPATNPEHSRATRRLAAKLGAKPEYLPYLRAADALQPTQRRASDATRNMLQKLRAAEERAKSKAAQIPTQENDTNVAEQ